MKHRVDQEQLNNAVIDCLCREYQSVWLVALDDMSMSIFKENPQAAIKGSIATAQTMSYEDARRWYIENHVVPEDRKRLLEATSIERILEKVGGGTDKVYSIDYKRLDGDVVNYNQLFYADVNERLGELTHFVLGFRNIEKRRRADIDDLTGVYTRKAFFERAHKVLQENPDTEYDILISDIVDFKAINENHGVKVGDAILAYCGLNMVPENVNGTIYGRYGGDQFVALIKHDKMQYIKEHPEIMIIKPSPALPQYTTKFGICEKVDHSLPVVASCDYAHIALNSIKHKYGTLYAVYDDDIKIGLETQRRIEKSMHQALEEEQFKVYYQPKHDALTGKVIGAEALVRWIHPEYGFMSPADFIPLFERNGFVTETDMYVWRRTCKNLRRWMDKGMDVVPISVNASKLDFMQTDIVKTLDSYINESELSPEYIHVEVTESLMEENIENLINILNEIKNCGYKVELDDFGAGYSSINILSTLPIDVVKLDMSFVKAMGDEKRSKVLAACIALAKNLGYKTVSEGVETEEQHSMLVDYGIDTIQGYYYSKPLPEEEFEEYLLKNL